MPRSRIVSSVRLYVEASSHDFEGSWVTTPSGVVLRSDAVAALECEAEEIIDRHGRAIVIGRIRNVFKIGGSGALVRWRGAYNSIGWTDDEVRRAVGRSARLCWRESSPRSLTRWPASTFTSAPRTKRGSSLTMARAS
jgi:hypothetical protein